MVTYGDRRRGQERALAVANRGDRAAMSPSPSPGKHARGVGMRAAEGGGQSLHQAVKLGDLAAAQSALAGGEDRGALQEVLNARDIRRRTPLHVAAAQGNEDLVRLLIEYGAGVNAQDGTGETPLHAAAGAGHAGVVGALLEAARAVLDAADEEGGDGVEADPLAMFLPDRRGQSPLYRAAHRGHAGVVAVLLREGGRFMEVVGHAEDEAGSTPLHAALGAGHADVVRVMLEGVDEEVRGRIVEAVDRWNTKAGDLAEGGMLVAGMRKVAADRAEVGRQVKRERTERGLEGMLGGKAGESGLSGCLIASNRSGAFAGGARERRLAAEVREQSRRVVKEMRGIIALCLTGQSPEKPHGAPAPKLEAPAMAGGAQDAGGAPREKAGGGAVKELHFHFDCTEVEEGEGEAGGECEHYEESFDIDENAVVTFNFDLPPWFWAACADEEGEDEEGEGGAPATE